MFAAFFSKTPFPKPLFRNPFFMPIRNISNPALTTALMTAILQAVTAIENASTTIVVSLDDEERKEYGSINEQNKLIVNKVLDYRTNQPALSSPKVDWVEFQKDYDMRRFYEGVESRLMDILGKFQDAKITHDYDNYQASLLDYKHAQSELEQGDTDYRNKVEEIKQFFSRTGTGKSSNEGPATNNEAG